MDENEQMLNEEVRRRLVDVSLIDTTDEELRERTKDTSDAYELLLKVKQAREETRLRELEIENDRKFKEAQLAETRKKNLIDAVLCAAGIVLPLMFYKQITDWGYAFETTGTHTSKTFQTFLNKLNPTKR